MYLATSLSVYSAKFFFFEKSFEGEPLLAMGKLIFYCGLLTELVSWEGLLLVLWLEKDDFESMLSCSVVREELLLVIVRDDSLSL
jgi:hypothetical protein